MEPCADFLMPAIFWGRAGPVPQLWLWSGSEIRKHSDEDSFSPGQNDHLRNFSIFREKSQSKYREEKAFQY